MNIEFESYLDTTDMTTQAFALLYGALMEYVPGGDVRKVQRLSDILDLMDDISIAVPDEQCHTCANRRGGRQLSPAGGTLRLDDAKTDIVTDAWNQRAPKLPGGLVRQRLYLDKLMMKTEEEVSAA